MAMAMAMKKVYGNWAEEFYPGTHDMLVYRFASDFERHTDPEKMKANRKRGRRHPRPSSYGTIEPPVEKPVFPDDIITQFQPLDISKGKPLDLISLLTITGDSKTLVRFYYRDHILVSTDYVEDIETYLKGKLVCVICFHVPVRFNDGVCFGFHKYSLFAKEMIANYSDKFQMVLVVKMRPNWAHNHAVFTHFVSAFSPSCLVVPFQDTTRIDAICRSINLQDECKGLLVGPDRLVVHDNLDFVGSSSFLDSFLFPHQNPTSYLLQTWRGLPLDRLFKCHEPTKCLRVDDKYNESSISLSELANNKVVGLYLCGDGYDIPMLHKVYDECRAQHLDFEVVLVFVPFSSGRTPEVLKDVIAPFLRFNKIPFWVSTFSYTVSRRLFAVTYACPSDKLLILSYGKLVELDGEVFVRKIGSLAYPFDRESIIQRALGDIQKLTLESLLEGRSLCRGNKPSDEVSVTCLESENVILFLGSEVMCKNLYELIDKHYDEIKLKRGGFEVVFVCLDDTISPPMEERISSKPWLVFHLDNYRPRSVMEALSLWGRNPEPSLVACGDDGKICSLNAEEALNLHGSDAFPLGADVREQIVDKLIQRLEFNWPP